MLYFLVVAKFLQILIMLRVRTSKSALVVMLVISPLFCKMSSELQKRKKKVANIKDQSGSNAMAPDATPQITREPIYDDIELTDKTNNRSFWECSICEYQKVITSNFL